MNYLHPNLSYIVLNPLYSVSFPWKHDNPNCHNSHPPTFYIFVLFLDIALSKVIHVTTPYFMMVSNFLFSRYFPSNGELVHIFVTDMKMPEELEKLDQVVRDLQNQVSNMISLIELDSTLSES